MDIAKTELSRYEEPAGDTEREKRERERLRERGLRKKLNPKPRKSSHSSGMWFALDDARKSNGCLWAIPGSHLKYPVKYRYIRSSDGVSTAFQKIGEKEEIERPTLSFPDEEFVPVEVPSVREIFRIFAPYF